MTSSQKRKHKFLILLRFGQSQGWIIPREGNRVVISENAPGYFHDRLARFKDLFQEDNSLV
jgi:hypothetical protein